MLKSVVEIVSDVISYANTFCCFVDGSWISSQRAGIGWALYNRGGELVVQGLSSIDPISSALETEGEALRLAIIQMKRLGFDKITFCGDSELLYGQLCNRKEEAIRLRVQNNQTRCMLKTS
ncbi:hypothetical protein Bca52824_027631 [Brassica carinata]|uniref:RNase H type-1 domain-containing protein n=1 Tax=Brassica carinata TaxID=52824 RepID=A0A8X8ANI2_BRACI|nr:hypothetical protein Bca52824_027631 [Brassica carinata]